MRVTANGRTTDRAGKDSLIVPPVARVVLPCSVNERLRSVLTHRDSKDEPVLPTPVWALWRELTANDVRGL